MADTAITDLLKELSEDVAPDLAFADGLREHLEHELAAHMTTSPARMRAIEPVSMEVVEMRNPPMSEPGANTRAWWLVAAAAATVVVLVGALLLLGNEARNDVVVDEPPVDVGERDPSPDDEPPGDTGAAARSFVGAAQESIEIEEGGNVYRVAVGDHVWVMSLEGDLTRIDPTTLEATAQLVVAESSAMATGADALWVADTLSGDVRRVDPETATVVATINTDIRIDGDSWRPIGVAWAGGAARTFARIGGIDATSDSVWVGDHDGLVLEIDPAVNAVVRKIEVGLRPDIVRVDGQHLLVGDFGSGTVAVFDTSNGAEVARHGPVERLIGADLYFGAAYVQDAATGTIGRTDLTTGDVRSSEPLGRSPEFTGLPVYAPGPVVGDAGVLVEVDEGFVVLDPVTLEVRGRFQLAGGAGEMTIADDGSAWIARYTGRMLNHLVPTAGEAG